MGKERGAELSNVEEEKKFKEESLKFKEMGKGGCNDQDGMNKVSGIPLNLC